MDSQHTPTVAPPTSTAAPGGGAPHILICPFVMSGHIIPILDLARQLLARGLTLTVWVTPANLSLLQPLLAAYPSSLEPLVLSVPDPGVDLRLVDRLRAIGELRDPILQWAQSRANPPAAIISDMFLGWTRRLALDLGVPRIVFYPSGAFAMAVINSLWRDLPQPDAGPTLPFPNVPNCPVYPWRQVQPLYRTKGEGDPDWEFYRSTVMANLDSWGAVNTCRSLEGAYVDHAAKDHGGHGRIWAVGPLLPGGVDISRGGPSVVPAREVLTWLDDLADDSVLYACFGSRHVLDREQTAALAAALELSRVRFVWCVRQAGDDECRAIVEAFEDRVAGRGLVVKGWAPQVAILMHRAVGAFLTHCGWNSTLEGVVAGVLMLTWPMKADQYTNEKLLVEQLGVGIRVAEERWKIPEPTELARAMAESVDGAKPQRVRAVELRNEVWTSIKVGTSNRDLDGFVKMLVQLGLK